MNYYTIIKTVKATIRQYTDTGSPQSKEIKFKIFVQLQLKSWYSESTIYNTSN